MVNNVLLLPTLGRAEESLCKLKMMVTFIKVKGQQRSNVVNYVLWLPYLVTRTAETMVKESKVKERSNFTKYRRNVRLFSDLFTDLFFFFFFLLAQNFHACWILIFRWESKELCKLVMVLCCKNWFFLIPKSLCCQHIHTPSPNLSFVSL